ncbi:MAG: DUF3726 domain-containing protein [Alphaproteobacteria bacterium]|nr:DUF3726 domain-containing protein [Alphaproteobacteria bacterium]
MDASLSTQTPAINRSVAEIRNLITRAGRRADLPSGEEDEAARAVEWLEKRGYPGLSLAVDALFDEGRGGAPGRSVEADGHALLQGPGIFEELLEAQDRRPGAPSAWTGVLFGPIALIPFAAEISLRRLAIHVRWDADDGRGQSLALCASGSVRLRYAQTEALITGAPARISIMASDAPIAVQGFAAANHVVDAWELDKRADHAVQNGVTVSERAWSRLDNFASGYLFDTRERAAGD